MMNGLKDASDWLKRRFRDNVVMLKLDCGFRRIWTLSFDYN